MRKLLIILVFILCTIFTFSQESADTTDVQFHEIQKAYDAIMQLREASESGDSIAIEQAYERLYMMDDVDFEDLRTRSYFPNGYKLPKNSHSPQKPETYPQSNRDHEVYSFHDDRSIDADVSCMMVTVGTNSKSILSYTCRGDHELAVVAGAGGMVTIEVHVTNTKAGIDFRADDTDDVRRGRPYRKRAFKLPGASTSTIEVKIINCSDKACNVVLIKNN